MLVRVLRKLFRLGAGRFARLPVADQFDRTHAAKAAHVADKRKPLLPRLRSLFKTFPDRRRPRQQSILLNSFDGCEARQDRKSTRLNSSHTVISYAVFCLKKKTQ